MQGFKAINDLIQQLEAEEENSPPNSADRFRQMLRQRADVREPAMDDYFSKILNENGRKTPDIMNEQYFGEGSSLLDLLKKRESGGDYGVRNSLGFSGAYQFGAPALESAGLLKPGTGKRGNKALNDPNNWTIEGGLDTFLSNPKLQDQAAQKLLEFNRRALKQQGLINEDTDPNQVNAMLAAAHLAGPGGVKALMSGQDRRDAYGTPASEYFKLGLKAR